MASALPGCVSVSEVTTNPQSGAGADDIGAVFDACAGALYRYFAVRLGGDRHAADDLMQQLWLQAQRLAPAGTPEGDGSVSASAATPREILEYRLRRIATNLVRTHWRRAGRRPAHVPLPEPALAAELASRLVTEELPETLLSRSEVHAQLLLALTELPADQQELLVEYYFHGRSHADLARQYATSDRAVEGRLYRARNALREKLQDLEPA